MLNQSILIAALLQIYLVLLNDRGQNSGGISMVKAATQRDIYNLMDILFYNYKPEVRPLTFNGATLVFIQLHLLSIQDLDEKSQVLKTSVIVETLWRDTFLYWNETDFGDLSDFLYPQSQVWLPDVVIENSVESQGQLGYNMNMVRVYNTGWVIWKPSQVIKTACDIDITYYPFDTQTCNIFVSTWMSTRWEVFIASQSGILGLNIDKYRSSGTWELLSNKLEILPDANNLTRIQFSLTIKRLRTYYVLNIVLPVLFLSFTASLVFFLPADAGEKIGMGITVLLACAVYLTIIADNMPQTSLQVSYLAVYLTLLLGLTALGVVLAVVVLHIHHKPDDCNIGKRAEKITRNIRACLGLSRKESKEKRMASNASLTVIKDKIIRVPRPHISLPPSYTENTEEEITWPKVAETLERVMFILTSCLIAVITIVFIPLLVFGS